MKWLDEPDEHEHWSTERTWAWLTKWTHFPQVTNFSSSLNGTQYWGWHQKGFKVLHVSESYLTSWAPTFVCDFILKNVNDFVRLSLQPFNLVKIFKCRRNIKKTDDIINHWAWSNSKRTRTSEPFIYYCAAFDLFVVAPLTLQEMTVAK